MNKRPGEFELINRLTAQRNINSKGLVMGVGDDASVVLVGPDKVMLFSCDAQVEGVHFNSRIDPFDLGRRLAATNLSDIAAMGGIPKWALVSLFLPSDYSPKYLDKVYDGLYQKLGEYGASVIGGNIAGKTKTMALDLFIVGESSRSDVMYRSGAKVGEIVCVTGYLGDSGGGLALSSQQTDLLTHDSKYLLDRHFNPTPRIKEGRILSMSGVVKTCMDISDGLIQDLVSLAKASDVKIEIDAEKLPISSSLKKMADFYNWDPVLLALGAGEDYELLFSIDADNFESISSVIMEKCGIEVFDIGIVKEKDDNEYISVINYQGNQENLKKIGFDHLKNE